MRLFAGFRRKPKNGRMSDTWGAQTSYNCIATRWRRNERGSRGKRALRLFSAAYRAIIVEGTGRDAELLRIMRRRRADADSFVGVTELPGSERSLPTGFG
jgi:hypothetical protein